MKLLHLSDLHLGTSSDQLTTALHSAVDELHPQLLLISGDFTQIGSTKEYRMARSFLDELDIPFVAVPGNHDISRFNLWKRFFSPYKNYKAFIQDDLNPRYDADSFVLTGLNSARRVLPHWNWANGAVSGEQREMVEADLAEAGDRWRLCMLHHPIHLVDDMPLDVIVFGGKQLMKTIYEQKVDVVLTGHVHHASFTVREGVDDDHPVVFLSASTALSSRVRTQKNGFNLIELDEQELEVTLYEFGDNTFKERQRFTHKRLS